MGLHLGAPASFAARYPQRSPRRSSLAGRLRRHRLRRRADGAGRRPTCRSASSPKAWRPPTSSRRSRRSPSTTSSCSAATDPRQRHRRLPARAPERRRPRRRRLPAHRSDRPQAARGRGGKMVQVRIDAAGQLEELVARFAAPRQRQAADPVHAPARRALRRQAASPTRRWRRWRRSRSLASGTIRSIAVRRHRRSRHPGCGGDAAGRDLRHRHRLPPRAAARARRSRWSTRPDRRRRADHLGQRQRPAGCSPPSSSTTARPIRRCGSRTATARAATSASTAQSKQRSFLASPIEFSRVTSGFAMRMHPILNTWRQHNGVDYGAPSGTPVRDDRRRRRRIRRLAERLRQRRPGQAQRRP